ncbi:phage tail tape measure protein [Pseudomonas citronellolis]|uniref:Phage tail tape measure protein n=1 Tax=Pseudomonas citronellolis TaxID=53408 RepID=A0AAW6P0F1_9PSED|nr:phage tail tape measure protein [Pseudomonas citronellolis]MDF3840487.1 phage tail tape measure protein [Pseudomonas citronellolis]WRT82940.1 phage tail tape measure protein [Pseudomonas citronellolis]
MTDVRLSVSVDAQQGRAELQNFRAGYTALVDQLRRPLGQIASLRDLQTSLVENDKQLNVVRDRVRELANELISAEKPTKAQQLAYRAATAEAKSLEQAIAGQKVQLTQLSASLKSAGVDTNYLSNEQKRLAADLAQASAAADQQARVAGARAALGIRPHREIRNEVALLQQQYATLQRVGGLSTAELAQAQVRLRERTAELLEGTNGWAKSLGQVHVQAGVALASVGALAYGGGQLLSFYARFAQEMAAVDSITNMTRPQLQAMSRDVRDLSVAMGRDAAQSAEALNDILSSGVSDDNGLAVLALSTKAAIAGLTETKTAAAGGLAVVNAYGESIQNLELRYDQMFLAVKDGVTTFPELAQYLGDVLPSAKAAGVGFDEVAAAIARMTIAGIRTPQAVTALKGAINALAAPTPDAQKKMDELGITWKGLTATLEDIASRKLGLDAMRQLIPDVEARTAVLSLTQYIKEMRAEVTAMGEAGGAMEAAYQKMADTPQADLDRFNAALAETKLQLGEAATAFLPVIQTVGDLLKEFNSLPEPVRVAIAALVTSGALIASFGSAIRALRSPFELFLGHLRATPGAAAATSSGLGRIGASAASLIPTLRNLATVANLAKGSLALGVIGWTGSNLLELYDLYEQNQELTKSQRDYEQALNDTIATTAKYGDVVIQPAEALARMNDEERKAYAESLRLAQQHYQKQSELLSRRAYERDPSSNQVDPDALAAAKRAGDYRRALEQMEHDQAAAAEALEAAEQRHNANMDKIRADNLKKIQVQLAAEMRLYDQANKRLQAAKKQREAVAKEFSDLSKDMRAAPSQGAASLSDVYDLQAGARQSLARGRNDDALRQAREAAKVLRELKDAGENGYGMAGIADNLGKIANEAAKNVEGDENVKLALVKAEMDDLLAKAEALKRVNIEFTGDEKSMEQLEQQALALAERLKKYMVIPVNYVGVDPNVASSEKAAGKVIDGADGSVNRAAGGWVDGPGSFTSDSIRLNASRGEFVLQARAAQRLGAMNLEHMNRTGELPGRAELVPHIPSLPALERSGERQPLNLEMPWGGSYALEGSPAEVSRFDQDLRKARIKFGGTGRG